MGNHTPGPWVASSSVRGEALWHVTLPNGRDILVGSEVDARFIAAGPEMEKALEGAEKILDSAGVRNWVIGWKAVLEDVRAALAKARGEPAPPPIPARTYDDLTPGELNDIDP